jgi:hypothetical protein
MPRGERRPVRILVALGLLVILAVAYARVLTIYKSETATKQKAFQIADTTDTTYMEVFASIRSIDAQKEEAVIRMEFEPFGDLSAEDGFASAFDVRILVNASAGRQEFEFQKNKRINPIEFTVSTTDGNISQYPFDKYTIPVEILMTAAATDLPPETEESTDGTHEGGGTEAPLPSEQQVPIDQNFVFSGTLAGWEVNAKSADIKIPGYVGLEATVSRAKTAIYFANFIIGATLVIALGILFLVLEVALQKRRVELPMITLAVIVSFALPALRNFLPGQPPVGVLLDFVAFFWAQGIVALGVICLTTIFLWRGEDGYPRARREKAHLASEQD